MKQLDILRFWRDVEIFDLPDFNEDAVYLDAEAQLPWHPPVRPAKKHYKWRYTLIFGKIEKKRIIEHLNTILKAEVANDWEEPVRGYSCFSALILDEGGCAQEDSYVTASYTFGINALEKKKELSSVAADLEQARQDFLERFNIPWSGPDEETAKGEVVFHEHLKKEISYLKELNTWWKEDIRIFVLAEEVPKDSEHNSEFLNSFYLDDLNHLSSLEEKKLGIALQNYLALKPSGKQRKDLIQDKQLLFETIAPGLMTAGRWPSATAYGLYTAQSGAVNTIFANLRNKEGVQVVNGPPGTGKTTLLLDIIAEIVVERAKAISNLGCNAVFETGYTKIEKESGYTQYTYNLDPSLKRNFGIVVASNNNAAVENISKELPLKSKIDASVFPEADYFSECAGTIIDEESWGVLAAALGNSKNRNTFRKAFWQSDRDKNTSGFNDLLYSVYKDPENDNLNVYSELYEQCDRTFRSLLHKFDEFRKDAGLFHEQAPLYIRRKTEESGYRHEQEKITESLSRLSVEGLRLAEKEEQVKSDADRSASLSHLHAQLKPSFFFIQKLFNTKSFRKWNTETEKILTELQRINTGLTKIRKELDLNRKDIRTLQSRQREYENSLSGLASFFAGHEALESKLSEQYGIEAGNLFNIDFYQKDLADIHLLNPYHSPETAKLRSDIFIAALQLHRASILVNAKKIRNNLAAYFEMTSGWVKADADIAQNLWDTFFLCVPVVSTTLASASRLFPNTQKKQIGWLLIDEAGQATPQSAAGLIHRAKRCVIVGDPLQVEPVVTIPEKLVTKLRNEHGVKVDWSPCRVSVQQLADRASLWGTYMDAGGADEKIWTGFPLRTHRRCDDPMFSIANEIAYGNQMVKAVDANSGEPFIGVSRWFNVNAEPTLINRHVVKEEIDLLIQKISELRDTGYTGNIYVISPFRSIALYCDERLKNQKKVSSGTIHKFQGKEADIVFLVLGSNPKSAGARNWASQKPNMLNVALTRAKKRFYVIGNKKLWSSCNYFNIMAKVLG